MYSCCSSEFYFCFKTTEWHHQNIHKILMLSILQNSKLVSYIFELKGYISIFYMITKTSAISLAELNIKIIKVNLGPF